MKDTNRIINKQRRNFLAMLASAGISESTLKASSLVGGLMATRFAHAQNSVQRVVFVYTSNGAPNGLWLPKGKTLNAATLAYEGLQDLCHFREVAEIVNSGHGQAHKCLGELRGGSDNLSDTIDQQIAACIGTATPYQSYALGVQTVANEVISRKAGGFIPCENSPATAYKKLFGGSEASGNYLERRKNILDHHRQELRALRNSLGAFEKETLDAHEVSLNAIQTRIEKISGTQVSAQCKAPAWNANGYDTKGPAPDGELGLFGPQAELQADIIVAALQCGLTNVMTLQLGTDQGSWYGHDTQFKADYHSSCHAAKPKEYAEMTNYLSRCVAYLVRRLRDSDDPAVPGTKMLRNTLVVQVTDMGNGQDHSAGSGPNMIATQMPAFKVGQATSSTGNNYHVLEAVVEGLGLAQFKGKDQHLHKIWPCGGGIVDTAILS